MDSQLVTLIVGILSGTGLYGFVRFLIERKDSKNDELKAISKKINSLSEKARISELNDSKMTLSMLIWHSPEDHRAVITEGERYFLELKGDSWMFDRFKKWSEKEKVDVSYILNEHDKRLKKGDKK